MCVRLIVTATTHDRDTTVRKRLNISKQADKRWPDLITLPPYSPITVALIYPDGGGGFSTPKKSRRVTPAISSQIYPTKKRGKKKRAAADTQCRFLVLIG